MDELLIERMKSDILRTRELVGNYGPKNHCPFMDWGNCEPCVWLFPEWAEGNTDLDANGKFVSMLTGYGHPCSMHSDEYVLEVVNEKLNL